MSVDVQDIDPVAVIGAFDDAWNLHDVEGVLAFFADDAVVTLVPPPPGAPGTYNGTEEIRGFVQGLISGFRVASRNHRVIGDAVTWESTVSSDAFRQLGIDPVECSAEAVRREKITSFTVTFSPDTVRKLQAAGKSSG